MNIDYSAAANCLKMLAQPIRLAIVDHLSTGDKTVSEIAEYCGIKSNLASEHLKLLRLCNFVKPNKVGRTIIYSLAEPHIHKLLACIHLKFGENTNGNNRKRTTKKA